MKGDTIRTGWYCPTCHRVFRSTVAKVVGLGRFHSMACDAPMIRCSVVTR